MASQSGQQWPKYLWLVRHGQSAGNVARDAAERAGLSLIDIATRDVDVPLSALGREQSDALGLWFGQLNPVLRPSVILFSPYLRARDCACRILESSGIPRETLTLLADERLREKEFGILDRLTKHGTTQKYPELSVQRSHVGKFYFRPPGGESWCDVILRLRSVIETLSREYCEERVLIVGHQVIVNCFRYLLEHMNEEAILAIDRAGDVPNCAVTSYDFGIPRGGNGQLIPELVNFVVPLERAGTPVTVEADVPGAAKP